MAKEVRERLLTTIEEIPESKLGEALDLWSSSWKKSAARKREGRLSDPGKDPILEYIGGVSHGALAKDYRR